MSSRLSIDVREVKRPFTRVCFLQAIMGLGLSFQVVWCEMNSACSRDSSYTQVRHVAGMQFCSFAVFAVSQFRRVVVSVV